MPGLPPVDEVTGPWWEATRSRTLLVQRCAGCEQVQHPPRAVCITCGRTDDLGWRPAGTGGVVDACTVVQRPVTGREGPYVVARVRLDIGVVMLSNVVTDAPDGISIGDRLRLVWRELSDGRALPVFEPEQRN